MDPQTSLHLLKCISDNFVNVAGFFVMGNLFTFERDI